jgi:hypothetical protein
MTEFNDDGVLINHKFIKDLALPPIKQVTYKLYFIRYFSEGLTKNVEIGATNIVDAIYQFKKAFAQVDIESIISITRSSAL